MRSDYRYFISIDGVCKNCGYPVICESGEILEHVQNITGDYDEGDYHLYCSNPDCENHKGLCCYDTEVGSTAVPFLDTSVKWRKLI